MPFYGFSQEEDKTKDDILKTFGKPFYQNGYKDTDVWYYEEERIFIFFDKGKVVKIDYVGGEEI